jgi:hypothetical protein
MSKSTRAAKKDLLTQEIKALGWPPTDKKQYALLDNRLVRIAALCSIDEARDRYAMESNRLMGRISAAKKSLKG